MASRSTPSVDAGRAVDRDAQRAATELEVVEIELEVGDDGNDQALDLLQRVGVAHLSLLSCLS